MISITETVTTDKPRDEVFAYLADFTTVSEWDPGIISSERTSGDGGMGTTYAVTSDFRGRKVDLVYEVVDYQEPEVIVLRGTANSVEALDRIEFHAHGDGTRVVYNAEFTMKGLLRFAEPFMGGMFTKLGRKAIAGMDRALNG